MYIQIICPIFCLQKANNYLLFTTVFSKDARWNDQLVAVVLALATALAYIQLLAKYRTSEKETAIRAAQLEVKAGIPVAPPRGRRLSSGRSRLSARRRRNTGEASPSQ